MKTGFRGTFVISWSQTAVDGTDAAPLASLTVGAAWSWHGDAIRVDGPTDVLQLDQPIGDAQMRKGAARMVRRLVGAALAKPTVPKAIGGDPAVGDGTFVVTDGLRTFTVTLIDTRPDAHPDARPLLMFVDRGPPQNTDLWIVAHGLDQRSTKPLNQGGDRVICFTPGTWIATPQGPRLVEDLTEGDAVQTRDNGAQPVQWIGQRHFTGARLFAMPQLRPIRIRADALGPGQPDETCLVSPGHRMLITGARAQALFNTDEVLVAACDLINGGSVAVDHMVRNVTYVHLLLPRHEIVFANGIASESFHPASAALDLLAAADRTRLLARMPEVLRNPQIYGAYARRCLTKPEAAILMHNAA